jgi:hypothetical protein
VETEPKSAKRQVDRWSFVYLAIMLAGWVAAVWFMLLSMGGGFLGIFLNWCLGLLLLIPIGYLLRDLRNRGPHKPLRLVLGILALTGITLPSTLLLADLVTTWQSNPVHDINGLPSGSHFTRTRFEFRKGTSHFIIRDPGNHLRFCFGAVPAAIRVEGDERVVDFEDWVILKSWTFDYGFEGEAIHFGGWMGASSNEPDMEIGPDGLPLLKQ